MHGIANVDEAALRIFEELKEKKYLILLDEVWDMVDLKELTTTKTIVINDMELDEIVDLEPLSLTDDWKMFKENVGHPIFSSLIKLIAWCVVDECQGLPLLIDKVSRTFRRKDKNVLCWEDGLRHLKR